LNSMLLPSAVFEGLKGSNVAGSELYPKRSSAPDFTSAFFPEQEKNKTGKTMKETNNKIVVFDFDI